MSFSYATGLVTRRLTPSLTRSFHTTQVAKFPPTVRRIPVPINRTPETKSASTASEASLATEFDVDDILASSSSSSSPDLAAAGEPIASVPLTNFPNDGYKPLPSADGMAFPGESVPTDWTTSFAGLSAQPFPKDVAEKLMAPLDADEIEIKPDGLLYFPEIRYRRRLNQAFGPGGWGLAPRGETHVTKNMVTREWGLVCLGRLVAVARGEQEYFGPDGIATATEACKSNAMLRCCKDLGIASELWDPTFIRKFKAEHCVEVFAEHATTKKKKKLWRRKDAPKLDYPWKEGK